MIKSIYGFILATLISVPAVASDTEDHLRKLPHELQLMVTDELDPEALRSLCQVRRDLYFLLKDPSFELRFLPARPRHVLESYMRIPKGELLSRHGLFKIAPYVAGISENLRVLQYYVFRDRFRTDNLSHHKIALILSSISILFGPNLFSYLEECNAFMLHMEAIDEALEMLTTISVERLILMIAQLRDRQGAGRYRFPLLDYYAETVAASA